jgi:hypothetical protein
MSLTPRRQTPGWAPQGSAAASKVLLPAHPVCLGQPPGELLVDLFGRRKPKGVQHVSMIYMNPTIWETLSEEERNAVFADHDAFQKPIKESGELVGFAALADPSNSTTVRVRGGVPAVTDGPYVEAKEHLAGFYVVDCESVERANELPAPGRPVHRGGGAAAAG